MKENPSKALSDAKRLEIVLESLGITAYGLAKKLGYKTASSVYHVKEGRNNLSSDMIHGIVKNYPRVNYLFLKEGKGEALLAKQDKITGQQELFGFSKEKSIHISEEKKDYPLEEGKNALYFLKEICEQSKQTTQLLKLIYQEQIEIKKALSNK
ncbi:hypothetical protein LB465_03845 [Salegentibacter sp. LM13S]|uniref:hypothetical protein n=1 Tax=Salegentibacter lacus TaxID=2873599 RepID=UPI001CD0084F|nr:hypothetical protein [Salegentibacter lacus]MBZ9629902.1 hypothetical protein [Salegentibacter lacus]